MSAAARKEPARLVGVEIAGDLELKGRIYPTESRGAIELITLLVRARFLVCEEWSAGDFLRALERRRMVVQPHAL